MDEWLLRLGQADVTGTFIECKCAFDDNDERIASVVTRPDIETRTHIRIVEQVHTPSSS
jgi:hypothetical protein